ncbi:MAG: multicopper oxidase domain-containing protein [Bacteroidetes bacterium]|nr:multicopper oxidase domain-containing protein [Bacteroidota bacterium]
MKKIINACLIMFSISASAQTQLAVPDTLVGTNFALNMHKDSVQFFPTGNISHTYAFNQYKYLGPTLIFNKGDNINISVTNQIGDTTTVHWHGLHVAAANDGGPHTPIMPNATWNPQFMVMDNAATYWYHPHTHKKTAKQAIKGAAGLIIVRDAQEAALTLPRKYGVDDFPVIVQCQQYDSVNQAMSLGMEDSTIMVNGARANNGYSVYGNFPAQVVRMRLLNASGERSFNFGFTGNKSFYQIASDGGLLNAPISTTRVRLSPGERAEILIDLSGMNGQNIYLMSYASEIPMGVQGGPTMPMPPGSPPMDSPLNGIDFNIFKINVVAPTSNPVTTIPSTLVTNTPYQTSQAAITRTINMTAINMMSMDGPFYFNGQLFDMMRIDYHIPMNNIEIWTLSNQTMVAHPFHIHGVQFYVLDRDGNAPPANEQGRKDVVLVSPNETVRFIAKFEDFADSLTPYMYHCHVLMHEDDGMMGQYVINPLNTGVKEINGVDNSISIYPNPANGIVNIETSLTDVNSIAVYNALGELVYSENKSGLHQIQLNTNTWSKGMYNIIVNGKGKIQNKKLIVN